VPMSTATVQVACFGEILWDIFETSKRGDEPIAWDFRRELGGAPANVATGLARLGVHASVIGGIGRDRFGDALLRHLQGDRVDTRFILRLPNRTGLTFVTRDARGEPSFLFYRHETADVSVTRTHVIPAMGRAVWILVGTSTMQGRGLASATHEFLRVGARAGAHLIVDLNVRAHLWSSPAVMRSTIARMVRRASLVKASLTDLEALAGAHGLRWLGKHAPEATWLVTRGPGKASAIGPHGEVTVAAAPARCIDATGAGDAFVAGSLAVLLEAGATPDAPAWVDPRVWRHALEVGHELARLAISRPGSVRGLTGLARIKKRIHTVVQGG
jgi:fructokinase